MSDLPSLAPVTEADFNRVTNYIAQRREVWEQRLNDGQATLTAHLEATGYTTFTTEQRPDRDSEHGALAAQEVVVSARLKETAAVVAKMRRFGEPLRLMLDIWGYRLVVPTDQDLVDVANSCAELWDTPAPEELLLRHGQLQFEWWRDYRQRSHAGLSPATTDRYDQAIHLNRKAPFGIVEIQVMTLDLYIRVHGDPTSDDSHDRFVQRRQALFDTGP